MLHQVPLGSIVCCVCVCVSVIVCMCVCMCTGSNMVWCMFVCVCVCLWVWVRMFLGVMTVAVIYMAVYGINQVIYRTLSMGSLFILINSYRTLLLCFKLYYIYYMNMN